MPGTVKSKKRKSGDLTSPAAIGELRDIHETLGNHIHTIAEVERENMELEDHIVDLNLEIEQLHKKVKSLEDELDHVHEDFDEQLKQAKHQWAYKALHMTKEIKKNSKEIGGLPDVESVIQENCNIM